MSNTTETKHQLITESLNKGQQSVIFSRIFKIGDKKLNIEIKSDSYDFQSYATIKVFCPEKLQWNHLYSIHYSAMKTPYKLAYRTHSKTEFSTDAENLTKVAEELLS